MFFFEIEMMLYNRIEKGGIVENSKMLDERMGEITPGQMSIFDIIDDTIEQENEIVERDVDLSTDCMLECCVCEGQMSLMRKLGN